MFTGIVQAVGTVKEISINENGCKLFILTPDDFLVDINIGDSIAVQGVCLTVTGVSGNAFDIDISNETLQCTTLGEIKSADSVNLEPALTLATKLSGHLVSGHVDAIGSICEINKDGDSVQLVVESPHDLSKYIAQKGSICIDGISLTVNSVSDCQFMVNIIPHTFSHTTLKNVSVGSKVNLEADLIARYLDRLQSHTG